MVHACSLGAQLKNGFLFFYGKTVTGATSNRSFDACSEKKKYASQVCCYVLPCCFIVVINFLHMPLNRLNKVIYFCSTVAATVNIGGMEG